MAEKSYGKPGGRTWVVADPHFGHWGVCKFLRNDGTKLRPWDNPDEMDEALVQNWNSVVHDGDRVYVLGDVVINRRCLPTLSRLKGRKVLVKGNHDVFKLKDYTPYFDDIRAYVVGKTASHGTLTEPGSSMYIMSHIPIHPVSLGRFKINIHGHLHSNVVMEGDQSDSRYKCVSVENINFTPLNLNEIIKEN